MVVPGGDTSFRTLRMIPGDSANSLLRTEVHSKLVGQLAPCGSMPLPGSSAALTAAEVDLIAASIDGGALDDRLSRG